MSLTAVTDERGRFSSSSLPAGEYQLVPDLPQGLVVWDATSRIEVPLSDDGCAEPTIDVRTDGRVRGVLRGATELSLIRTSVDLIPPARRAALPDVSQRIGHGGGLRMRAGSQATCLTLLAAVLASSWGCVWRPDGDALCTKAYVETAPAGTFLLVRSNDRVQAIRFVDVRTADAGWRDSGCAHYDVYDLPSTVGSTSRASSHRGRVQDLPPAAGVHALFSVERGDVRLLTSPPIGEAL